MTLEAVDGDLQVTISEVKAHNVPVTQARIDHWNTAISRALNRFDARTPNTDIEAITVSTDGVTVTFNRQ